MREKTQHRARYRMACMCVYYIYIYKYTYNINIYKYCTYIICVKYIQNDIQPGRGKEGEG